MVALALNGWTVPLAQASLEEVEIGSIERAFAGAVLRQRRATKRQWQLTTGPMLFTDAEALEALLCAYGEQWPGNDAFTAKGLAPLVNSGITVVAGAGKWGDTLWPRAAQSNLVADNVATGTDALGTTSGFTMGANGGYNDTNGGASVITSDATQAWQGTRSLKFVGGSGDFYSVRAKVSGIAASTTYTFSAYVRAVSGTVGVLMMAWNQASTVGQPSSTSFSVGTTWTRISHTFTTPSGTTGLELKIGGQASSGVQFYTDGWQLQQGSAATTWVQGTSAGASLAYDVSHETGGGPNAITIAGWMRSPSTGGVAWALTDAAAAAANTVSLTYPSLSTLQLNVGATDFRQVTWASPAVYTHIAVVVRRTGSPNVLCYLAGQLVGAYTMTGVPSLAALTRLWFGSLAGASFWNGYVDELTLAAYEMPAGQVAGLAALPAAPPAQPAVLASGDLVMGPPIACIASEVKTSYLGGNKGSAWRPNLGRLEFLLSEV